MNRHLFTLLLFVLPGVALTQTARLSRREINDRGGGTGAITGGRKGTLRRV